MNILLRASKNAGNNIELSHGGQTGEGIRASRRKLFVIDDLEQGPFDIRAKIVKVRVAGTG